MYKPHKIINKQYHKLILNKLFIYNNFLIFINPIIDKEKLHIIKEKTFGKEIIIYKLNSSRIFLNKFFKSNCLVLAIKEEEDFRLMLKEVSVYSIICYKKIFINLFDWTNNKINNQIYIYIYIWLFILLFVILTFINKIIYVKKK